MLFEAGPEELLVRSGDRRRDLPAALRRQRRQCGLVQKTVLERLLPLRSAPALDNDLGSQQAGEIRIEFITSSDLFEDVDVEITADHGRNLCEPPGPGLQKIDTGHEEPLERRRQ